MPGFLQRCGVLLALAALLAAVACKKKEQRGTSGPADAGRPVRRRPAATGIRGVSLGIDLATLRRNLPPGSELAARATREVLSLSGSVFSVLDRNCHCYLPGDCYHLHVRVHGEPAACDFHLALDERLSAVTCRFDDRDGLAEHLALVRGLVSRLTKAHGAAVVVPEDPEKTACAFGEKCEKVWRWKTNHLRVELSSLYGELRRQVNLALMTPAHARLEHTLARLAERQCRAAAGRGKRPTCVGVPAITPHEIAMVVRAHRHRVRACYRDALARDPKLAGRVVAQFELTDDGARVTLAEADTGDASFESCVLEALQSMRFPPLRYRIGQRVRARYPFTFRPERPGGARRPASVTYRSAEAFGVKESDATTTITLPDAARAALDQAFPGHRLLTSRDFAGDVPAYPFPFAVVSDLDKRPGDDLALVLASRVGPGSWRLVVVPGNGQPSIAVADSADILPFFRVRPGRPPGFFLTTEGRCFCERRCVAIGSDLGRSFEFSRDGDTYTGVIEDYLPD